MGREIKFRAWHNQIKEMTHDAQPINVFNEYLAKEQFELMQYTGLTDKNGVSIYEGDIVKTIDTNRFKCLDGDLGIVSFTKGCFTLNSPEYEYDQFVWLNRIGILGQYGEVIGNIYENSNLMEK